MTPHSYFRILRQHTIEGMFSGPDARQEMQDYTDGNSSVIREPLMNYRAEIDKSHGVPWRRKPVSFTQVVGRPGKGMGRRTEVERFPALD